MDSKRIWELDALRGLCILVMVVIHLVFDLVELFGLVHWVYPPVFAFVKDWGGVIFLLISGVCITLGSRCIRRGLIVLACGALCTLVTALMYWFGMADRSIIIWFGVLHCLGVCMLLWPVFRRLPVWALGSIGAVLVIAGFAVRGLTVPTVWLAPLGLTAKGFVSSDYFPLLPDLGFFLLGAVLGRTVYRSRRSLLPRWNAEAAPLRFLCFCGRQSLPIYLLHQPILSGICLLLMIRS